jgi:hypothetical protein
MLCQEIMIFAIVSLFLGVIIVRVAITALTITTMKIRRNNYEKGI